jgi:hypothetical protein
LSNSWVCHANIEWLYSQCDVSVICWLYKDLWVSLFNETLGSLFQGKFGTCILLVCWSMFWRIWAYVKVSIVYCYWEMPRRTMELKRVRLEISNPKNLYRFNFVYYWNSGRYWLRQLGCLVDICAIKCNHFLISIWIDPLGIYVSPSFFCHMELKYMWDHSPCDLWL